MDREKRWERYVSGPTEGSPAKREKLGDLGTRQTTQHKKLRTSELQQEFQLQFDTKLQ